MTLKSLFCCFFLCLLVGKSVNAQRLFSIDIDSLRRSYLLAEVGDETKSRAVFILLHDQRVSPVALARLDWSRLHQPALLVFPVALQNRWACSGNKDSLKADQQFIMKMIFHMQGNFKIDRSRIFLVGVGSSYCLAKEFSVAHPSLIRATIPWNAVHSYTHIQSKLAHPLDSLSLNHPSHEPKVLSNPEASNSDFEDWREWNEERYGHRTWLELHMGRWQQATGSRTDFDTLTLTDLSKYHLMFGFEVRYHINTHWSVHVGSDFMIIPKERKINSISWGSGGLNVDATGKGGLVMPYGAGVRYSLDKKLRPHFSAAVGSTFMFIGGGKASGGLGSINKSIYKRKESLFRYALGTGFELPLSKGAAFQLSAQYSFSSQLNPPLASVDRFEGFSIFFGLQFLLNKK